ncbi:MAG: VWA domain-containing protein [Candidatus Sulfotelmatobacter sp.]
MVAASRLRVRVAFALIACVAGSLAAQENSAVPPAGGNSQQLKSKDLVFKTSVRRVIVDVVVSDSLGNPVPGLTAGDFRLKEDGQPQKIRTFDLHDFDPPSDPLPNLPEALPANTFVNVPKGPERGPLYVLLLDLLNMETADQPHARQQLLEFIRKKPEGTRFAVFMLSDRLYQVQGFTEDRALLAEAVDPKTAHSKIPKIFLLADNFRPYISTPAVLGNIGEYLANLSGRKNLIWFSGSFPSAIMMNSDPKSDAFSINDQIKAATDSLARGRVAVYPVDARGTVSTAPATGDLMRPMGDSGLTADATLNATYMTEEEIARATGGRAYHGTNDLAGALTAATETGGRYYTLTYSPTNLNYDGRLRHIQIDLAKRGYRLEYRRTYFGNADSKRTEPARDKPAIAELTPLAVTKAADSLYPNMQHGAPIAHQLLFRAHFQPLSRAAKATREHASKIADQIDKAREGRKNNGEAKPAKPVKLQTYQIDYTIAARYPLLEVAAAAYDDDGKILNSAIERVIEQDNRFPDAKNGGAIYRVQQRFDVPVNAASVRVAVRDVATDNVGALEIKLPLAPEANNTVESIPRTTESANP